MLASRASLVIKKIDTVENQKERKRKKQKYDALLVRILKVKDDLDSCIEFKYILGNDIENIKLDSIKDGLDELKNDISYDNINEREVIILKSMLTSIENQLKSEWKKHYEEKTIGIIQTLTNIKPFFNDRLEIEKIINSLNRFENIWPINRQKYDKFIEDTELAKVKIGELKLTDDIRRFINRIINNTATIDDLTPHILKWIKDNKYESKIKLSFK